MPLLVVTKSSSPTRVSDQDAAGTPSTRVAWSGVSLEKRKRPCDEVA
jgi:hypothetical protein